MTGRIAIEDEPTLFIDKQVEKFFHLTREALNTDSIEEFCCILQERRVLLNSSEQLALSLSPESRTKMLFIERKILMKLEKEKRKISTDIDKLSRQIRTIKTYTAKFPFPSMPAFFDQAR